MKKLGLFFTMVLFAFMMASFTFDKSNDQEVWNAPVDAPVEEMPMFIQQDIPVRSN